MGHVQALTLNCMNMGEEHIDLSRYAHRARLLAFAVSPLKAWLSVQDSLHGGALDPNQKSSKRTEPPDSAAIASQ